MPADSPKGGGGFEEKSFAEYHLYTLGRPTTLANAQTKQIELINVTGVPIEKKYLYHPSFGNKVGVVLEFKNAKETAAGLGIPLPKGPVRVYLRGADDESEFLGGDEIDHTPKDEPVRLRIGFAFDVVAERVMTNQVHAAAPLWNEDQTWSIKLRNHKDQPVSIVLREPMMARLNWRILKQSHEWTKIDAATMELKIDVPANEQREITYTVRYENAIPVP
jgi:hypothetical protein